MADTAWLAPSIFINASTHLRAAQPLFTYPGQADRALASNPGSGPLHPSIRHATHPHLARRASPQCRLPDSSGPGILELEVVVDDQLSEFSEGKIRGRCVRSVVGERRLKRFRAWRSRWVMQELGSGRVGLPRAQAVRLIASESTHL